MMRIGAGSPAGGKPGEARRVAVLPLPLGGVPRGRVLVTVAGATIEIFFVTEESEHVDFFRSVIALENADEAMFERLARSAFPALERADNVWHGLGNFPPLVHRSARRTSPLFGRP